MSDFDWLNYKRNLNEILEGCHVVMLEEPVVYKANSVVGFFEDMVLPYAIEDRFGNRDLAKDSYMNCWGHCAPHQYDQHVDASLWLLGKVYPGQKYSISIEKTGKKHYRASISFGERLMLKTGIAQTPARALAKALFYRLKADGKL